MVLAALHVAVDYCLLSVYEHGWLPLAVRIRVRLAVACFSLWFLRSYLTKKMLRNVTKPRNMFANRDICHSSWESQVLTKSWNVWRRGSWQQIERFEIWYQGITRIYDKCCVSSVWPTFYRSMAIDYFSPVACQLASLRGNTPLPIGELCIATYNMYYFGLSVHNSNNITSCVIDINPVVLIGCDSVLY